MQKQNGNRAVGKGKKVTGEPSEEEETDGRREDEADGRVEGRTDDVFRCQTMLAEYKTEERPRGRPP